MSPFHSFRETSIVQQSASSLHRQPSFIPLQMIQEQKPYSRCTIGETYLSREEPDELASLWSGPVTRSRLRAQEESLQHLAKSVGLKSEEENQDKPAWKEFLCENHLTKSFAEETRDIGQGLEKGRYVATALFRNVATTLVHAFSSTLSMLSPEDRSEPISCFPPF
ncbi:hypothetical protein DY000_02060011 [Brassica cretica]|uniref:Rab3 GTPase-activating protein catalytic subunit n=1 Tax=Brassica cretica TaxID=69181 RepID=A0ABQ7ASV4_BRACR|nr:hypothetical protein DY000_02060011 [Brassica cretica]